MAATRCGERARRVERVGVSGVRGGWDGATGCLLAPGAGSGERIGCCCGRRWCRPGWPLVTVVLVARARRWNASASAGAQGQSAWRRRRVRRPWRTTRPAVCSSRWRSRFGSAVASSPVRQVSLVQASRSWAISEVSSQVWLCSKAWWGRLRMPVSLPSRMLSSTRARPRWRSSSAAMSSPAWSVRKQVWR